jgi:hypothetical protein
MTSKKEEHIVITVDLKEIKEFEKDLKVFASSAYPYATRDTVNETAFKAMSLAKEHVNKNMVIKNAWTMRGIKVSKTKSLIVSQQQSVVGSVDDYMERQEFGGVVHGGKVGKPIATSASANQGSANPRTKATTRSNRLSRIKLHKRHRRALKSGMNRHARIAAQIRQAAEDSEKYVYLETKNRKGIYRLQGGRRKPKIKSMVWDLSRKNTVTKKNPWLKPSVDEVRLHSPRIYRDSLIFQLKRFGLFR